MAKTIMTTWHDWPNTCKAIARIQDDFALATVKRAWKIAYIEHYKHRDHLRQELSCPITLPGGPHPNEHTLLAYELLEYTVDSNYAVTITDRRTVQPFIDPRWGPMPEDMKEKVDSMLNSIGSNHGRSGWYRPSFPQPRSVSRSAFVRDDTGDVDVERVRKLVQQSRSHTDAYRVPEVHAPGDETDRDIAVEGVRVVD